MSWSRGGDDHRRGWAARILLSIARVGSWYNGGAALTALLAVMAATPGARAEGGATAPHAPPEAGEARAGLVGERALLGSLPWGAGPGPKRFRYDMPVVTTHKMELEPPTPLPRKSEVFFVLAELTGERLFRRVGARLSPFNRAIAASELLLRTNRRATFVEIEELRRAPVLSSTAAWTGCLATGALLLTAAIAGSKLLPMAFGEAWSATPSPWPMGIRISGRFDVP